MRVRLGLRMGPDLGVGEAAGTVDQAGWGGMEDTHR